MFIASALETKCSILVKKKNFCHFIYYLFAAQIEQWRILQATIYLVT